MLNYTTSGQDDLNVVLVENEHPGILLKEDFLEPYNITQNRLAKAMGVPRSRISAIVNGERSITADTSIRMGRALGVSDMFFFRLQVQYDELKAKRAAAHITSTIEPIIEPAA